MNPHRVRRLDGTEALTFLFGPATPTPTDGAEEHSRAERNGHMVAHLANLVEGELWTIRQWLQGVWLERRCPASGQPIGKCAESACRQHQQQEIPEEIAEAIRGLKKSRFLQGARPHLHELGEAVIARLRRVCDILALAP